MSWSASAQNVSPDEVDVAIREVFETNPAYADPAPGLAEQVAKVAQAAQAFAELADIGERLNVSAGGHARQSESDPTSAFVNLTEATA